MAKKRKRHRRLNPDQILADATDAGPNQFIDHIHRLNPTGLELSEADRDERYRLWVADGCARLPSGDFGVRG